MAIFQLIELNIMGNPPCFQYARARGHGKWRHKLCPERMCSANARNDLNDEDLKSDYLTWKWHLNKI